ncbi:PREDICTED: uncharacterized protein LOC105314060 [Amphimedon queenslandica]|uniref:Glycosyltransferase family 92 protein n=1 Tax=Amphimedon queenslandica TaxID=400682 RepID=A0A1X7U104_AMPQE|nr:PREDICTED: uncharacterized protein LOC105314060 [Amphimedon queenslandica]|eukprot:XP_019856626.1 PREDICTED: uncharacterized protein LOC105314060 [Amphimedon queenslandica]
MGYRRGKLLLIFLFFQIVLVLFFFTLLSFGSKSFNSNKNERSSIINRDLSSNQFLVNPSILAGPTVSDHTTSSSASTEKSSPVLPATSERTTPILIPSHFIPDLLTVPDSSFKMYSAYLDDREKFYGPAVYVLGIDLMKRYSEGLRGLITYNNGARVCIGPAIFEKPCDYKCNRYVHYTTYDTVNNVFKLNHPLNSSVYPTLISISRDCTGNLASKPLKIHPHNPNKDKRDFGICIQTPVYGKVQVEDLVYFIEMNKLLGAEWIMMYSMIDGLENNDELQPYIRDNLLTVVPWPKIFKKLSPTHYFGEILSVHDCLYRSLSWIKHLVLIDIDELIIPRHGRTWSEMIGSIPKAYDAYLVINTYYTSAKDKDTELDKVIDKEVIDKETELVPTKSSCHVVPYFNKLYRYSCMFRPYRRSKVLIRVDAIKNLDIHAIPSANKAKVYIVPTNITSLLHYRGDPTPDCKNKSLIYDSIALKYKRDFILNSGINVCHENDNI